MNTRNKSIGIIAGIAILVLIGLVWFARPAPGEKNTAAAGTGGGDAGAITADEHAFDFGTISMAAGTVRHAFPVKNGGDAAIAIKKMYTSCMCTTASLTAGGTTYGPFGMPGHGAIPAINANIPAGETASVEVVFDPAAHGPAGVGKIERIVRLERERGEPLELHVSAFVTP
ncbi:MAG: hypothetical protein A3A44_02040 [Candidatus Sungbacteria bacterium RIFCSPLOWO2_01_FULL_60_25]|uniref:DUF1573 domain-containing protein n=1 Tax=Candidatus Sungbacteria bacterium RIFCSPLOWO2_01_FULL_60_25 TaxID=1802281 RepID=A0A1G2LFZ3_9BACT|nr:MAG: hypothetical protein A3A44_02040 [Candidatus Sungbacteria bacterium RIFCSPLOWO2_01_FULL_60_25]